MLKFPPLPLVWGRKLAGPGGGAVEDRAAEVMVAAVAIPCSAIGEGGQHAVVS
jgi:hypothetical protein